MEQKSLLFIFSSAAPQRTADSEVPSQMAAHLRKQQSTVGWGDCWIRTKDCSFTIWCHYQWATTAPKSHHCSLESPLLPKVLGIHGEFFSPFSSKQHAHIFIYQKIKKLRKILQPLEVLLLIMLYVTMHFYPSIKVYSNETTVTGVLIGIKWHVGLRYMFSRWYSLFKI